MAIRIINEQTLNECNLCGYIWKPRRNSEVSQCARCQSCLWNRDRKKRGQYPRPERITKEAIEDAIRSFGGHYPTLQELGDLPQFHVTREWIRQRCEKLGIKRINAGIANAACKCSKCGRGIGTQSLSRRRLGLCRRCSPAHLNKAIPIQCVCGTCGVTFPLSLSKYNARMRTPSGLRTVPRTWPLFCNRQCTGVWFGKHHGMGNPNRTEAQRHRKKKEFCKRGHPLSGDNLYVRKGNRFCRACDRWRYQQAHQKKASILVGEKV